MKQPLNAGFPSSVPNRLAIACLVTTGLLLLGTLRLQKYFELQRYWNTGDAAIREHLGTATRISIRESGESEFSTPILAIDDPTAVRRLVNSIEFSPSAPISYWRIPMLPGDWRTPVSFCIGEYVIDVANDRGVMARLEIVPGCGECKLRSERPLSHPAYSHYVTGSLTTNSYQRIAAWFGSYGFDHYAERLP